MNAIEETVKTVLAKDRKQPTWEELKTDGFVLGGEPRVENDCLILPLETTEKLSKSGKTYMRYGTGGLFVNLPDGSRLQVNYLSRWNPVYIKSKELIQQMRLQG